MKSKITNKELIGDENSMGYKRVILYRPEKKRFFIHRLVALHFINGYSEDLVVNHKDGNKQNNNVENLEWVTRSENDIHAFTHKLRDVHPCEFKKKIVKYDLITGETLCIYNNTKECEEDLNVKRPNIYDCCNGKQKSCRGFGLRYET